MASPIQKSRRFGPPWCLQLPPFRSSSRRYRTRSSCRCTATPTCPAVSTTLGTCWTHKDKRRIKKNCLRQFWISTHSLHLSIWLYFVKIYSWIYEKFREYIFCVIFEHYIVLMPCIFFNREKCIISGILEDCNWNLFYSLLCYITQIIS